ncbi:hypothetical protein L1887_54097 [Cichorium endivia]|nr:hypothetical protein L1887_54097 [Cichorium endivia]
MLPAAFLELTPRPPGPAPGASSRLAIVQAPPSLRCAMAVFRTPTRVLVGWQRMPPFRRGCITHDSELGRRRPSFLSSCSSSLDPGSPACSPHTFSLSLFTQLTMAADPFAHARPQLGAHLVRNRARLGPRAARVHRARAQDLRRGGAGTGRRVPQHRLALQPGAARRVGPLRCTHPPRRLLQHRHHCHHLGGHGRAQPQPGRRHRPRRAQRYPRASAQPPRLCAAAPVAQFRPGWTVYQSAICRSLACDWRRGQKRSKRRPQDAAPAADTWAPGAATERFDRKRNKKLAKQAKKDAAIEAARVARAASQPPAADGPKMKLLHSDVLDLPVAPVAAESPDSALEAPDVIASLNYAMAYFHDRATLLRYLRMARATLSQDGRVYHRHVRRAQDGGDARGQYVLRADRSRAGLRKDASTHAGLAAIDGRGANRARPARDNDADDEEAERVLELMPAPESSSLGTRAEWPRGKLKLVRTGEEHGGFEYWREDGPVDWMTNRFRMSLSFRFSDASWLRDVFSYDFRVWSIKELTEAMEEAGFVRVQVHILPRNIVDSDRGDAIDDDASDAASEAADEADSMAGLLLRTEKEERNKSSYTAVKAGEKVFANRSFASKSPFRIQVCHAVASK